MEATSKSSQATLAPWLVMANEGAVVVTFNQRAARYLIAQHTALMRSRGVAGWPTPRILSWDAWLSNLWAEVSQQDPSAPVLISAAQENELWRDAIKSFESATRWNEIALANLAQQAWRLLLQYADGLPALSRYPLYRHDWQQFQKWASRFTSDTRRGGWLPTTQLARELEHRLRHGQWHPPAQLILWGFDEFTPSQQMLLAAIRESDNVDTVQPSVQSAHKAGHTFASVSQQDEIDAAATWVQHRLIANPEARLAIITTNTKEDRGLIYRTLANTAGVDDFSFSLGFPLSSFPLVATACNLLRWIWQPLPPQQISAVLLAPSLQSSYESLLQLAEFDCDKFLRRESADPSSSLEQFVRWLQHKTAKARGNTIADFLQRCEKALRLKPRRESDSADNWAELFRSILSAFGFPAPLSNSSADFQTWKRWELLLDDFATLGFNGAKFSAYQALERLQKMAEETVFQPESQATSVEILGPIEASGSLFDGIFFLSCTEDRWPMPVSPNPLLSLDLQQAQAMPGAVRGNSIASAKRMTERLIQSAPEVIFSFPAHGAEGELRRSPVLDSLAIAPVPATFVQEFSLRYSHPPPRLVESPDLPPLPWQFSRGHLSVSALRSQAACPFQAFASQRLGTSDLKQPEDGLDPLQRGNLLHNLLHDVWLDSRTLPGMRTSERLRELVDAGQLEAFVAERANALVRLPEHSPWEREFLTAERERITMLVCRWLTQVELHRAPFEVVEGEAKREIAIENLVQLSVRLDRLDKLVPAASSTVAPDEYVLLDYKTGKIDLKGWQPPRLDEPQLPLYSTFALPARPVAVAFGSVRTGVEMGLRGIAIRADILPDVAPDRRSSNTVSFADVLEDWRRDIVTLAQEFAAGGARVDPKRGADTCKYCGLQSLCRVAETGILLRDDDEASSDNDGESA